MRYIEVEEEKPLRYFEIKDEAFNDLCMLLERLRREYPDSDYIIGLEKYNTKDLSRDSFLKTMERILRSAKPVRMVEDGRIYGMDDKQDRFIAGIADDIDFQSKKDFEWYANTWGTGSIFDPHDCSRDDG